MKILSGLEEQQAQEFISQAAKIGLQATCQRSKCGAILVSHNQIIGQGYNSPVHHQENQRRCTHDKTSYHRKVTDKTCCIHAEQRAMLEALKNYPDQISTSRLYFIRLDSNHKPQKAGHPYCTVCSKLALEIGVQEFVLWQEEGICVYDTDEYNTLSYQFTD